MNFVSDLIIMSFEFSSSFFFQKYFCIFPFSLLSVKNLRSISDNFLTLLNNLEVYVYIFSAVGSDIGS